ncbi:hypothetical protein RD149_05835 [Gordonia westfalica]|uniref:Uncharacterized protein n=1 Tax=Gordonia westfalica TaxID=158898 RepID=A0A1H2KW93_9ACTN|nr:hypothetical protein [Gordonia westfalica]MDS1113282.1 hypothetical protein [Gordonia westfalica]SDU72611.1 hypothetical protein SAMN04488548_1343798 [Gordonia westfalica]
MDQDKFGYLTKSVFSRSATGAGEFVSTLQYTNDGVLAIAGESTGKLGFGIASNLTPSPELLMVVDECNKLMDFGHYWLAEGSDNRHWCLICGFKLPYATTAPEHVVDLAAGVAINGGRAALVNVIRAKLANIRHQEYWLDGEDPGAQALVLTSHLG